LGSDTASWSSAWRSRPPSTNFATTLPPS
jgi:hypothetical protein